MKKEIHAFSFLWAFALITTTAQAGIIISERFSGSDSTDLVGTATPDGNNWTGGVGEKAKQEESTDDTETPAGKKFSVKQDGSTGGVAFTAYHKFTPKPGQIYTLEAVLSPTNKSDNQWFAVGFSLAARDGGNAPNLDGGTTYGQTVLSGSGYRYGWTGPDATNMCELKGPGLHAGSVKVVLDTTKATAYTVELFDGDGASLHGPKSIGTPAITRIFIGSSGTNGGFTSVTLSDNNPGSKDPAPQPETDTTSGE